MVKKIVIDAFPGKGSPEGNDPGTEPLDFRTLNEKIYAAADDGCRHIVVKNALGQRFMCAGMNHKGVKIDIYGTPGNDLGVFMDGPVIEVHGNAEDQTGNTMSSGKIIIHGNAWDVTGLAARGGTMFVKGHGGYRIGIHMKEYHEMKPIIVYGGAVKEFFGEYMAGGILVALGLDIGSNGISDIPPGDVVKGSLGSGIHGGAIYIRGEVPDEYLGVSATRSKLSDDDMELLTPILKEFCSHFDVPLDRIWEREITKITPASSRPYASYYNYRPV